MIVTTLAGPAAEPLGLAEAKDYLRIAYEGEDGLVGSLIAGARARVEELAGVAMISRTLRVALDRWPMLTMETRVMRLPVRPAGELLSVTVRYAEGEAEDVAERFTLAAGRSARLVWTSGAFPWPGRRVDGIEIDYVAGFGEGADDVAEGLRLAVKRLVAHAYHSRDAGTLAGPLPEDVAGLISPWRRVRL
ncbi:MAG: hypothetical protein Q8R02_00550 [Hyphomonadaceae bacterium]|nr:hypothetical protein [Hyphomonadaceae bacterium]